VGFHVVVVQEATQNRTAQRCAALLHTTDATQTQMQDKVAAHHHPLTIIPSIPAHPHSTVSRSRSLPSILSISQLIHSILAPHLISHHFLFLFLCFFVGLGSAYDFIQVKSSSSSRYLLISTTITSPFHQRFHTPTDQVHSAISRPILISPCVHSTYLLD
jgi:hypothetical protein